MQTILFLVCGLPGSGKSSVAARISDRVFSADDFFMENGRYNFDGSKLSQAHAQCQSRVLYLLQTQSSNAVSTIAVANTFTQFWEIAPYLTMAKDHGARVVIVDCFDGGMTDAELAAKNVHGVPENAISAMRARWEGKRFGDARKPWERT